MKITKIIMWLIFLACAAFIALNSLIYIVTNKTKFQTIIKKGSTSGTIPKDAQYD